MNGNTDSRSIVGYFDTPKPSYGDDENTKISKGFINVLFEEFPGGEINKINEKEYFDQPERVFILDGFQECKARYHHRLIKAEVVPNNQYVENSDLTRYVTFKNNVKEIGAVDVLGMLHMKLPSALDSNDVLLSSIPVTRFFYIIDGGFAYGPFKFELTKECRTRVETEMDFTGPYEGSLVVSPSSESVTQKKGYISKFDYSLIKPHLITVHNTEYLLDIGSLKLPATSMPYMTRSDVLGMLKVLADRRKISKPTVAALRVEFQNLSLPQESKDSLNKIFEVASEDSEWQKAIIDIVTNTDQGKDLIESYVQANQDSYVAQWDKKAEEKHEGLVKLIKETEQRLTDTKNKVAEQAQLLANKQDELKALSEKEINNVDLEQKVQERRQQLDSIIQEKEAEINRLTAEYSQIRNYANISEAMKALESTHEYLIDRKNQLEQSVKSVNQMLNGGEVALQSELRKMVPYVSTIIQAPLPSTEQAQSFTLSDTVDIEFKEMSHAQSEVSKTVNYIAGQMNNEYGRSYSNEFISSVLVAQAQSLMSICTGAPGLGKTSFIRLLKRILKMENRFIEVPVGRSWVSEREFIGFFNSLSNTFSPSSSGAYQFLKGISEDMPETAPLSLMLLDEANLSAIEHYGAFLINISDDEAEKKLRLAKEEIRIPESFRIVATINHDLTTESLSPRLIDRAPVIPFDSFVDDNVNYIEDSSDYTNLSFRSFSSLFGRNAFLRQQLSIDNSSLPQTLQSVVDLLADRDAKKGPPIILSRRKMTNMIDYVYVLTSVLKVTAQLTDISALDKAIDFAVLYFVLPSVQGAGSGTKNRLETLRDMITSQNLELSLAKLSDILIRGEQNLETYNFFHY